MHRDACVIQPVCENVSSPISQKHSTPNRNPFQYINTGNKPYEHSRRELFFSYTTPLCPEKRDTD